MEGFFLGAIVSIGLMFIVGVLLDAYEYTFVDFAQLITAYGTLSAFLIALTVHWKHVKWREADRAEEKSIFYLTKYRETLIELQKNINTSTLARLEVERISFIMEALTRIKTLVTEPHHIQLRSIEAAHALRVVDGRFRSSGLEYFSGLRTTLPDKRYEECVAALRHELEFGNRDGNVFMRDGDTVLGFSNFLTETRILEYLDFYF